MFREDGFLCRICQKSFSKKFNYKRHKTSDKHIWNAKNPIYQLEKLVPFDIARLIEKFAFDSNPHLSIFQTLERGDIWGAYNQVYKRKPFDFVWKKDSPDTLYEIHRELRCTWHYSVYKCKISSIYTDKGDICCINLNYEHARYIWKRCSLIKSGLQIPFHILCNSEFDFIIKRSSHTRDYHLEP